MKNDRLRSNENGDAVAQQPRTSEAEDLEIVRQLQAGNPDALTLLFEKYNAMVFLIARRMLHDDGEAEEVVQQVFIDVYRAIHRYDERRGTVKTWLFQYSYHRTLNRKKHLETRGFYSRHELEGQDIPADGYEGDGRRIRLCSQEILQLVEELLNSIHPKQRMAIELTFFEGLTAEEIASRTGETAVVVRHNLYRGLNKLRAALLDNEKCKKPSAVRGIVGVLLDRARPL